MPGYFYLTKDCIGYKKAVADEGLFAILLYANRGSITNEKIPHRSACLNCHNHRCFNQYDN